MAQDSEKFLEDLLKTLNEEESRIERVYDALSDVHRIGRSTQSHHRVDLDSLVSFADIASSHHQCRTDAAGFFFGVPQVPYPDTAPPTVAARHHNPLTDSPPPQDDPAAAPTPRGLRHGGTKTLNRKPETHAEQPRHAPPLPPPGASAAAVARFGSDFHLQGAYVCPTPPWRKHEVKFLYTAVYAAAVRRKETLDLEEEARLEASGDIEALEAKILSKPWGDTRYAPSWDEVYRDLLPGFSMRDWGGVSDALRAMLAEGEYITPQESVHWRAGAPPRKPGAEGVGFHRGPMECATMWHNEISATLNRSYLRCMPDTHPHIFVTQRDRNSLGFWMWGFLHATIRESPQLLTACVSFHPLAVRFNAAKGGAKRKKSGGGGAGGSLISPDLSGFKSTVKSILGDLLFWPDPAYLQLVALYEMQYVEGEALALGVFDGFGTGDILSAPTSASASQPSAPSGASRKQRGLNLTLEEIGFLGGLIDAHGSTGNSDFLMSEFSGKFGKCFTSKVWGEALLTLTGPSGRFLSGFLTWRHPGALVDPSSPSGGSGEKRYATHLSAEPGLPKSLYEFYTQARSFYWQTVCYEMRGNPRYFHHESQGGDRSKTDNSVGYHLSLAERETLWRLTEAVNDEFPAESGFPQLVPYEVAELVASGGGLAHLPIPRLKEPQDVFALHLQRGGGGSADSLQTPDEIFVLRLRQLREILSELDISWRRGYSPREAVDTAVRCSKGELPDSVIPRLRDQANRLTGPSQKKGRTSRRGKRGRGSSGAASGPPPEAAAPAAKARRTDGVDEGGVGGAEGKEEEEAGAEPRAAAGSDVGAGGGAGVGEEEGEALPDAAVEWTLLSKRPAALAKVLGGMRAEEASRMPDGICTPYIGEQLARHGVPACEEVRGVLAAVLGALSDGADPAKPGFAEAFNAAARRDFAAVAASPADLGYLNSIAEHGTWHMLVAGMSATFGDTLLSAAEQALAAGVLKGLPTTDEALARQAESTQQAEERGSQVGG